jgi:FtsP/CotA-like multicopper oxidase with cupredoxin domain
MLTWATVDYQTAFQAALVSSVGGPPTADTALINGTMLGLTGTGGAYNKVTLTTGKKYRLRLINTSVDNHFVSCEIPKTSKSPQERHSLTAPLSRECL